jgi:hypothetical protein
VDADIIDLTALHDAILAYLRAELPTIALIDDYPVLARHVPLPAILIELEGMEPGTDPGTGDLGMVGRFEARCIVDPLLPRAGLVARNLAARVGRLVYQQTFGLAKPAKVGEIREDAMKPELDGYLCWLTPWTNYFVLGDDYVAPPLSGSVLVGMSPQTGLGHEPDYWDLNNPAAPANWGQGA